MRKKEVRWISRDKSGIYACFEKEPQKNTHGAYNDNSYIPGTSGIDNIWNITMRKGSLAKITIERQY